MKRFNAKLISICKITTSSTPISRNFTPQFKSPIQNFCLNSTVLPYKTHQFHNNPSHNYSSHATITPYFLSNKGKIKKSSQIEQVFETAKSAEEMIKAFKEMGGKFDDEGDFGLLCLKIGLKLHQESKDPEKILYFANKALPVFDKVENKCCLYLAMTLQLMGSANCSLKNFNDALGFLNRANEILIKLEDDVKYDVNDIKVILHAVNMELANVETGMGRSKEAVDYLRKSLELKEFLMGKDSREVGNSNRELAEAYVAIQNFKDGLPYCLKALGIHLRLVGHNSVQVGHDRRLLGIVYAEMGEYEKAFEQNRLAQTVFKKLGRGSDWIQAVIDAVNVDISLGRYEAALSTLEEHEKMLEENSENKAIIFISMGKTLIYMENFAKAKESFHNACTLLEKNENSMPLEVAERYVEISEQYEIMRETEAEKSLLTKALMLSQKFPQGQHLEGDILTRMGTLLFLSGKVIEAIPYLERAAETVKESFGSKHFRVGFIYKILGRAYWKLERSVSAIQMFNAAKDILDTFTGPDHNMSVHECQNLSNAYANLKRYRLAIGFQQRVVDGWEGRGSNAEDKLREARRRLEQLKVRARAASSKDNPTKVLPLPHSSDAS